MKVENKLIRRLMALTGSVVNAGYEFMSPIINTFIRRNIKDYASHSNPHSPWIHERAILRATPMNKRNSVSISQFKLKKNTWVKGYYYLEEHDATTLHYDFTIVANKKCYRMARTASDNAAKKSGYRNIFPGLGEKTGWIRQPEHLLHEVPNPAIIDDGYGAGTTKILKQGNCFVNVTSRNTMHVIFEDIDGVYTFVDTETPNQTLMLRKHHDGKWLGKHKMKEAMSAMPYIHDDSYVFSTKMDGAAVEWEVIQSDGKKYLRIHSYRQDVVAEKKFGVITQIEHTYRLKICDKPLPDKTPLSSGRGELWCEGRNGRLHVASVMNSGHYKARDSRSYPHLYIHDVCTYDKHNVEGMEYKHKLTMMRELNSCDSRFMIPEYAVGEHEKEMMWKKTQTAWRTKSKAVDGVIAWNYDEKNTVPVKLKFTHEQDDWHSATIIAVLPQEGKDSDKYAYPVVRNNHGAEFKISGKGLTQERKADLMNNPDTYIGMEIRYAADDHFESGTPFQPTIKEFNAV